MKYDKLLPIGSVIRIRGGKDLLMIMGCNQVNLQTRQLFDYSGVLYPTGYTDDHHVYIFDHDDIETVYAVGYLDEESRAFQQEAVMENKKLRTGAMTVDELLGTGRSFDR